MDSETLKEIEELLNPNCKSHEFYFVYGGRGCGRTYTLGMYKLLQDISECNKELEKLKEHSKNCKRDLK